MPNDNVVLLPCATTLPIPAERVLGAAAAANLADAIVIGVQQDGRVYYASTLSNKGEHLLMVERFKHWLIHEAL